MYCNNGNCGFCPNPCFRGEIKGNDKKISPISPEEEAGASKAFDSVETSISVEKLQNEDVQMEETGLAIVENIGSYEVKKNIFGKERVKKVR